MDLRNANVLVTGAGRGIGRFLADDLCADANSVIIADNNQELLDAIPANERVSKYLLDVTNPEAVERVIAQVFSEHPEVNVLINNAGVIHSEPLFNLLSKEDKKHSIKNWQKIVDVNLSSVFYVTANVVEKLISAKRGGVIINISSISASGNVGQSAYSATKAGVEALTTTWSKELGMFKIRCSCIAPGFFDTPSTRESLNDHMLRKWEKSVPIGRLGELAELASGVRFIITNEYFNGKILRIDGGLVL